MSRQATLGMEKFQQPGASAAAETEDFAGADEPSIRTTDQDAEAVREALLGAVPGQTVTVEGNTFHVAHVENYPLQSVLGCPTVQFNEVDATLVIGPDSQGAAWAADIPDEEGEEPADNDVIDYMHIVVGENPELGEVGEAGMRVTTTRECPECEANSGRFERDNVEVRYRGVRSVPKQIAEVRYCGECEQSFAVSRPASIDESDTVTTFGLVGEEGSGTVQGIYKREDTCLFPMMRQHNEYEGLWTASEIAGFLNPKMDTVGDSERFGYVRVHDDGEMVVWHDDQPYDVEVEFSRVDQEASDVDAK